MKKLVILSCIGILIGLSSCHKEDEFASFLKTTATTMNADGGSVTVDSKKEFYVIGIEFISSKDTCIYPIENYESVLQVKWIKLKIKPKQLIVTTETNTTGEERKAFIQLQEKGSNTFNSFIITQSK